LKEWAFNESFQCSVALEANDLWCKLMWPCVDAVLGYCESKMQNNYCFVLCRNLFTATVFNSIVVGFDIKQLVQKIVGLFF
jgi:hypothetical protein